MAKTAVILGKSAAVIVAVNRIPFSESTRTIVQTVLAQRSCQASSTHARLNLEESGFRKAGFTEKEIDEIGFALLGILKARHDA